MSLDTTASDIARLPWSRHSDHSVKGPRSTLAVLCVFAALMAVHASGRFGALLYPLMVTGSGVICAVGIRIHRPSVVWPWWLMVVAGVTWSAAGAARSITGSTGDLTASRSLVPDYLAVPGYLAFGLALWGLVHSHGAGRDRLALLDAVIVAAGSAAIVFSLIIAPTLNIDDTTMQSRMSVSLFPLISMFLLVGSSQLAFTRRHRSEAFVLLIAGSGCLTLGDLIYALGETGSSNVPVNVLDLPYLAVGTFLAAAALHPDTHRLRPRISAAEAQLGVGRLVAVSFAFLAPIVAVTTPASDNGRSIQVALCVLVTLIAVWRIGLAARGEAALRVELIRRADHDALTGLPSRQFVVDEAAALLGDPTSTTTSLMFLDLDGFKRVNDSLGHAAGDMLLMMVAHRLVDTVRRDDVVGRIGGDEFVIVCPELDADGARALGDRIRQSLRAPFDLGAGLPVHLGASVGVTVATHGDDPEIIMREADTAMYESKSRGRNMTTVFDVPMREQIDRHIDVEAGLRRAIECDEFSLVFQPIVNIDVLGVDGFEALIRWDSPDGLLSPAEFLSVAEDRGLMSAIGAWVLDESCRQIAHFRDTLDPDLTVSVNVSAAQVQSPSFVDDVAACLTRHALPGSALWLEIVETVMLDNNTHTRAVVMGLRQLGVRLAVDDFGTGYASLTHLRMFPVDRIKIDRSFVNELAANASTVSVVAAMVFLGRRLGVQVVAEGVETSEQQEQLADMGCDLIQGYLHSPGVPAAEVPDTVYRIDDLIGSSRVRLSTVATAGGRVRRGSRCRP